MKRLFVLRHAAAKGPESAPTDFERPLNKRGHRQARDVGEIARAKQFDFEAIVASPALRVVETISGLVQGSQSPIEPKYDQRAYNASAEDLVEIIREADDASERLLICGHNPGLQLLILELAQNDPDGHYDQVASGYSTATLAELRLEIDHWQQVGPGSGQIVSLVRGQD